MTWRSSPAPHRLLPRPARMRCRARSSGPRLRSARKASGERRSTARPGASESTGNTGSTGTTGASRRTGLCFGKRGTGTRADGSRTTGLQRALRDFPTERCTDGPDENENEKQKIQDNETHGFWLLKNLKSQTENRQIEQTREIQRGRADVQRRGQRRGEQSETPVARGRGRARGHRRRRRIGRNPLRWEGPRRQAAAVQAGEGSLNGLSRRRRKRWVASARASVT